MYRKAITKYLSDMKTLSVISRANRVLALAVLVLFTAKVSAEISGTIKGRVTDVNNQPIEFATATLVSPKTQKIVKGEVCNLNGEFAISNVGEGVYILSVSMVGYQKNDTATVVINKKTTTVTKNITLKESTQRLNDVVVVGKRPFIEQTADKMVINPDASITTASENVYEILKRLPGVTIDNNDNISLKGKQGVKVMIDEKPTYVSADQLATLLKSMQGKNVERIEIIENPSARYDAEGNSGIINIKTKHNRAPGFNGSVNAGITFTRTIGGNAGLDLNMNFGKVNVYGTYNFYDWKGWQAMDLTRMFTSGSFAGAYQFTDNESNSNGSAHNYKVGADYFVRKNHVISFMLRGNTGFNNNSEVGSTRFTDSNQRMDSTVRSIIERKNYWNNQTANLNYKWDIDTMGRSLTMDADYAHFYFRSGSEQESSFFDALNNPLNRTLNLISTLHGDINVISAKADYNHPINKTYNMEGGVKSSFVNTNSTASMIGYLLQDDRFIFRENIQAAYINARAQYAKTSLQLGLRLENTNSTGTSVSTGQVDTKSYLELFPSVFVQQTLKPEQTLGLRYSYRIGRPSYHFLNPFVWMLDPYTYNQGNPLLDPQFTHALSLNHNFKNKFMTSIGYNYTRDLFTQVLYQNDETKAIYQTMENLGSSTDLNISESIQLQPAKWWRLNGTVTGMYKKVVSKIDAGNEFSRVSYTGNVSNHFTLPFKLSMELSGYYNSKELVGNFTIKPRYQIDLGLQRSILKDKGTIKLSFRDIFDTGSAGAYTKYGNIDIDVNNYWETRRLNVTFTYRFGKDDFKTRGNRATASSEEESRSAK